MNIGEKPIDLVQLCRRILSEWQYHCPYLTEERLTRVMKMPAEEPQSQPQPQEARDQAMEIDSEPASGPSSTSDKNIAQSSDGVGETDKSSSDSGSSSPSQPSSQASSSSSESTSSKPVFEMTYFLRQQPNGNLKITTLKNFFDYCKPRMGLSHVDTANLYWGLRFRCVPMCSKFFCYAIIQAVFYLQDFGYTGLLLPGENVTPICNLLIRKFPIFPTEAQRWVKIVDITDTTKQDDRVPLNAQSGAEMAQVEHTVIVVKFLNGRRYVIDPTVAAFQLPTLEVKQDPVTKKKVYIRTDKLMNSENATGFPVVIHGYWPRYIDYIRLRSLLGTDPVKSEKVAAALRPWNVRPEDTDPDILLDDFSDILQEVPNYTTSLHSTIASVVANMHEECCTFCGEIERGAGDDEEYDTVELYKCGGCKTVRYCGKTCQEIDFYSHREICRKIQPQAQGAQGEGS